MWVDRSELLRDVHGGFRVDLLFAFMPDEQNVKAIAPALRRSYQKIRPHL